MTVQLSLAYAIFVATLTEAILYGFYVLLCAVAMTLLITRKRTKSSNVLIGVTLFTFTLSTAHMVMVFQYACTQYLDREAAQHDDILQRRGDPRVYIPTMLEIINCYVADAIVLWRAWVLWDRRLYALAIPSIIWIASIAEGIAVMHALAVDAPGEAASLGARSITSWTVAFAATTFVSNFWAVAMIGYRYYIYNREVVAVLGRSAASCRGILALIIESGLLYCCSWLIFIIVYMSGSRGMYVMFHLLSQLTGIYPTMIIVLVCLRYTRHDEMEQFYTSVRFTHATTSTGATLSQAQKTMPNAHVVDLEISYPYSEETKFGTGDSAMTELVELRSSSPSLGEHSPLP